MLVEEGVTIEDPKNIVFPPLPPVIEIDYDFEPEDPDAPQATWLEFTNCADIIAFPPLPPIAGDVEHDDLLDPFETDIVPTETKRPEPQLDPDSWDGMLASYEHWDDYPSRLRAQPKIKREPLMDEATGDLLVSLVNDDTITDSEAFDIWARYLAEHYPRSPVEDPVGEMIHEETPDGIAVVASADGS